MLVEVVRQSVPERSPGVRGREVRNEAARLNRTAHAHTGIWKSRTKAKVSFYFFLLPDLPASHFRTNWLS